MHVRAASFFEGESLCICANRLATAAALILFAGVKLSFFERLDLLGALAATAELGVAGLLLLMNRFRWSIYLAAGLFAIFTVTVLTKRVLGYECSCFGDQRPVLLLLAIGCLLVASGNVVIRLRTFSLAAVLVGTTGIFASFALGATMPGQGASTVAAWVDALIESDARLNQALQQGDLTVLVVQPSCESCQAYLHQIDSEWRASSPRLTIAELSPHATEFERARLYPKGAQVIALDPGTPPPPCLPVQFRLAKAGAVNARCLQPTSATSVPENP